MSWPHEVFKLSGCYNLNQGEGDNPNINDPTDDQIAERYIKHFSTFRLEPLESRYSLDNDGKLSVGLLLILTKCQNNLIWSDGNQLMAH